MKKPDQTYLDTTQPEYTERLLKHQTIWWKDWLDVQMPYRWNIQSLKPGFVLDIGCGIGRNLVHLKGNGIGIDHNQNSIKIANQRGLNCFTPEQFESSTFSTSQNFDSLLLAHVAEHMTQTEVIMLLNHYIPLLKPNGKLIIITPQESGYKSDKTHVEFMNFPKLKGIYNTLGFTNIKEYSFPFPRFCGYFFKYNEFISISYKP